MSRLDDLIDLIRTTNEVYFITAPNRVRTVYVLVDDIAELSLKTYLQETVLTERESCKNDLEAAGFITTRNHLTKLRQFYSEDIDFTTLFSGLAHSGSVQQANLQTIIDTHNKKTTKNQDFLHHWSVNNPENHIVFNAVLDEVSELNAGNVPLLEILDELSERHRKRNRFFHDHQQTGLTIPDHECLRALCDLFLLMEKLFPSFVQRIKTIFPTVGSQIGVLRLRLAARGKEDILDPYNKALERFNKKHKVLYRSANFEHSVLHTITEQFFTALKEQFENEIAKLELRVDKISRVKKPNEGHRTEKRLAEDRVAVLKQHLDEVKALRI